MLTWTILDIQKEVQNTEKVLCMTLVGFNAVNVLTKACMILIRNSAHVSLQHQKF